MSSSIIRRGGGRVKEEGEEEIREEEGLWENLPADVSCLITARLAAPELCMFRSVCKSWRRCIQTSSAYQPDLAGSASNHVMIKFPVLMTVHPKFCSFFHPMYNTTIRRVIPELVNSTLFHTKGEWALLGRRMEPNNDESAVIFFFNINTMVKIDVPSLPINMYGATFIFHRMCFFSDPDSTDWSIIGMDAHDIGTIKHGQPEWDVSRFRPSYFGISTNPVVVGGLCYSLGDDGKLFSFDPTKIIQSRDIRLPAVSPPPPPPILENYNHIEIVECFLVPVVEASEDVVLWAIFKHKIISNKDEDDDEDEDEDEDKDDTNISIPSGYEETYLTSVYEFNLRKTKWRKLDTLGNRMLFVARTGSILFQLEEQEATLTKMTMNMVRNKVYYPNFRMNNNIFFSLSTGSDHCFLLNPNPSYPYDHPTTNHNHLPYYTPSNCGWIGPMPHSFFLSI